MFGIVVQQLLVILFILAIFAVPVWLWGRKLDKAPIDSVAIGQKMLIYAVLLYIFTAGLYAIYGPIEGVLSVIGPLALVLSVVGVFRLGFGMGHSIGMKILFAVLMFIPPLNLITMLILNARATKALRAAGYKVGLLGASRQ